VFDGLLSQRLEQFGVLAPGLHGAVASSSTRFDGGRKVVVGSKDAPVPDCKLRFVKENVRDSTVCFRFRHVLVGEHDMIEGRKGHGPRASKERFRVAIEASAAGDLPTGFGKTVNEALHQPLAAACDNPRRFLPHCFLNGVQRPWLLHKVPQSTPSVWEPKFRMRGDQHGGVTVREKSIGSDNGGETSTDDENGQVNASMLRASTGQLGRQWSHNVQAASSTTASHPTR